MKDTNLVDVLRAYEEWAEWNHRETPIAMGDNLAEAADFTAPHPSVKRVLGVKQQILPLKVRVIEKPSKSKLGLQQLKGNTILCQKQLMPSMKLI